MSMELQNSFGSTSSTLLHRAVMKEQAAWDRLVHLCHPLVYSWVKRTGWQRADIENVVQEVFVVVARKIETYKRDRRLGTFRGWLRVVTRNKVNDYWRRRKSHFVVEGDFDVDLAIPMDPQDDESETQLLFVRVVQMIKDQFSDRDWTVFWRKEVEGQSAKEVADEFQMTTAAVYTVVSRIRKHVRTRYDDLLE